MTLRLISVLNFHLEWNSRTLRRRWWGSGSSKASGTAEQELTAVWQEKKSTFLVGVLWVRLSAENECVFLQEWYKPGSTSQKYFPHLFQPLLSLTSLRGVTGRSKESSRYTDSCHGFKEAEPHSIHHLLSHADNCTGSNELPMHPQNPPSSKHGL